MTLDACADRVAKGDPDRYKAVLAVPLEARKILLPIYAFNVEVARAPFASQEPMIAEMRLQWWWDMLQEIIDGQPVRHHEISTPLAEVLDADAAKVCQANVDARRRDAYRDAPGSLADLKTYLGDVGGGLMWVAARALGSRMETRARAIGTLQATANYLLAVPALRAYGIQPWPEMSGDAFRNALLATLKTAEQPKADKPLRLAEIAAWRAKPILYRAIRRPQAVGQGTLEEPEIVKRATLLWAAMRSA